MPTSQSTATRPRTAKSARVMNCGCPHGRIWANSLTIRLTNTSKTEKPHTAKNRVGFPINWKEGFFMARKSPKKSPKKTTKKATKQTRRKSTLGQYGIKKSGRWGKLSAAERAEMNIEKGLYFSSKITRQMEKDLAALLKQTAKETNAKLKALRDYAEKTGRKSPSMFIEDIKTPKEVDLAIKEIIRAKFFNDEETSTVEGTERFFDEAGDDVDDIFDNIENPENDDFVESMKWYDHDRWTIMRRIMQVYPNMTQSEVLDMIDEFENSGMSNDDITQVIIDSLVDMQEKSDNFNNSAHSFGE